MNKKIYLFVGTFLLIFVSLSLYFIIKTELLRSSISTNIEGPQILTYKAVKDKVGKLMALPKGEEPEIVYVKDIDKAKNQPFLVGAINGDVILLYNKAKLAILYDPVGDRIIQSGKLILASDSAK